MHWPSESLFKVYGDPLVKFTVPPATATLPNHPYRCETRVLVPAGFNETGWVDPFFAGLDCRKDSFAITLFERYKKTVAQEVTQK